MSGALQPGDVFAGYRIDAVLGRGGMGVVYRAEDLHLGRTVALKVLAPERANDPGFRDRFLRESKLLASIDHRNIVDVFHADEVDGQLFLVMRFIDGFDLNGLLAREGALEPAVVAHIVREAAEALDEAHSHGLVHRDVKPGNVLIAPRGRPLHEARVYLSDFGLTKRADGQSQLTTAGQFLGTPAYVAPEQIQGSSVDGRADLYALACVAYECLTGMPPYHEAGEAAILMAHLIAPPPDLGALRPELPREAATAVARGMAKSRDQRPDTCVAFAVSLQQALAPVMTVPDPRTANDARPSPIATPREAVTPPGPAAPPAPVTPPPARTSPDAAAPPRAVTPPPAPAPALRAADVPGPNTPTPAAAIPERTAGTVDDRTVVAAPPDAPEATAGTPTVAAPAHAPERGGSAPAALASAPPAPSAPVGSEPTAARAAQPTPGVATPPRTPPPPPVAGTPEAFRPRATRSSPSTMAIAAVVLLVVAVLGAGAFVFASLGSPGPSPAPTGSGVAAGTAAAGTAAAATASMGTADPGRAFPDALEDRLLTMIPQLVRVTCQRSTVDPAELGGAVAILDCRPTGHLAPNTVRYAMYPSESAVESAYSEWLADARRVATLRNEPTRCTTPPHTDGYGDYTHGSAPGKVICYIDEDGRAVFAWSVKVLRVMSEAIRDDGNAPELHQWWSEPERSGPNG